MCIFLPDGSCPVVCMHFSLMIMVKLCASLCVCVCVCVFQRDCSLHHVCVFQPDGSCQVQCILP